MKELLHIRLLKMSSLLVAIMLMLAQPTKVFSQVEPGFTPDGVLDTVMDYLGGKYSLGQISIDNATRAAANNHSVLSTVRDSCGSGYFMMYLESGCGLEGSAPANVARRNVVCQVLHDISQFIHSPLTGTGQKINMWVRCRDSVGTLPPNFLGVAAAFYNIPYSTTISGIQDNAVWITLNSGTDAYKNVVSPLVTSGSTYSYGATFFHGWMAFNTDTTIVKWNTSLTSPPDTGYTDLYEVALHEVMHALGFASLINYNGLSKFGAGYKYYTRYDEHLKTQGNVPLIKTLDGCDLYQWGFNSSLTPLDVLSPGGTTLCPSGYTTGGYIDDTDCSHAINYVDGAMTQAVYTSFCFQPASSLSHFEDYCQVPSSFVPAPPLSNNQYFLMSNAVVNGPYDATVNPGAMKRFPKPEERQVLCDIGYIVDTVFGDSTNLSYNNYHTTVCGNQVAGIDDGISDSGTYVYYTTGTTPVNITHLLSNDYNADSFKCLEVVIGSGTLSTTRGINTTVVTFTPTAGTFGIQLLRYIPKNLSTGAEGNITYVYVDVGDTGCNPTACDIVSNGGFEGINNSGAYYSHPWLWGATHCWTPFYQSPDRYNRGDVAWGNIPSPACSASTDVHMLSTYPNNCFVALSGGTATYDIDGAHGAEVFQEPLASTLYGGTTYHISFWAKISNNIPQYNALSSQIQLAVTPATVPYAPLIYPATCTSLPAGATALCNTLVRYHGHYANDSVGWQLFDTTLTYMGPDAHTLLLINAYYLNPTTGPYVSPYGTYIFVDDISIKPVSTLPTFHLPSPLCTNSGIINLDTTINISGGYFKWVTDSSGHIHTTTDTLFRPDSAYNATLIGGADTGVVTVCYYWTDGSGCHQSICANTHIYRSPAPIMGSVSCTGTGTMTDATPGGTWSSSDTSIAKIGATTGVITPISTGNVTITYTIGSCFVTKSLSIGTAGVIFASDSAICEGDIALFRDTLAIGGTWSTSNTAIGTIDSAGVFSGISPGVDTIFYTVSGGCHAKKVITVNIVPAHITGDTVLCLGSTGVLHDSVTGGTWSVTFGGVVTVVGGTGVITAIGIGIDIINYTLSTGCSTSIEVRVIPSPGPILGTTTICRGTTTTLTDAIAGGAWSSSNTSVATIGVSTGIVTGVAPGTTIITYTATDGCKRTDTVTVVPAPGPISGTNHLCAGTTVTLADTVIGGTWSSGDTSVATVGLSSGIVTGISAGTALITYTLGDGCRVTYVITVYRSPGPILGTDSVCVGSTTSLTDATTGGTWSSSDTSVATVGLSTGIVTGISPGVTVIVYTIFGGTDSACSSSVTVTVHPLPAPITGPTGVCVGLTIHLIDSTPGGTWTSGDTTVATVGLSTGIVTGVSPGATLITYTLPTGCYVTYNITVLALPAPIAGTDSVCVGGVTVLEDSVSGGVWVSNDTAVATIDSGGVVTGVSQGTAIISYIGSAGCYVTDTVTVFPVPGPITGPAGICVGGTATLYDSVSGGVWTSGDTTIVTVGASTGIITGISPGATIITYSIGGICNTIFKINVFPVPGPILGQDTVCVGSTVTLSDSVTGGIWSLSDSSIANIDPFGNVTGVITGTVIVSYSFPGCFVIDTVTVDTLISIPHIVGTPCAYGCFPLSAIFNGKIPPYLLKLLLQGALNGGYTIPSTGIPTNTLPINGIPINGIPTNGGKNGGGGKLLPISFPCVCVGSTTLLTDSLPGGTWRSLDTSIATVNDTGLVTGVSPGITFIIYSFTNNCGTSLVFIPINVQGPPVVGNITGVLGVCSGYTTTLYDSTLCGVWSTLDTTIISVDPTTGDVTGLSSGSATVTYSVTNSCGTASDSIQVVVDQIPYITTNFIVACQTLASGGGDVTIGHGVILPDTGCIDVCDSSIVRYYANGNAGAAFTWSVIGGIVVNTYPPLNDSIDVFWPTVGTTGSLTLFDTLGHCMGKAMSCIKVISKPHARFTASAINVCLGESVIFTNFSTADSSSPIVSYHWNFGDGYGTSIMNPTHSYATTGIYTVTLTVKNSCGCTDSMSVVITVSNNPGPAITCASIVCDSQRAIYSTTPDTCGIYYWSVVGGTIVAGDTTTASITVQWNNVGAGGFGYVNLVEPCALCPDTITIKVPVILQSPVISGPSVLCALQQYQFSLPLWAATQYKWGVLGYPGDIVGHNDNNIVTVEFYAPGTYTIHGWYQNRIALCGASVDTTITVVPPTNIIGTTTICQGYTESYHLADSTLSGTWTLINDTTGVAITSGSGTSFTYTFTTPGVYLLTATGSFCANPLTITVLPSPTPVDSVTGPDIVCLHRVYTYDAWDDTMGCVFSWQAIGGTVSPASGSDEVSVVWTSSGIKQLLVWRTSIYPPYCNGPIDTINIIQEVINPDVTGDVTPCANSLRGYDCNYTRGDNYTWKIIPSTAGSVVVGNYSSVDTVLWNNVTVPTPAAVVVIVNKCDSIRTDTLHVVIQPSPALSITASPNPACPGQPVTFTASSGGLTYTWDFGDGSGFYSSSTTTATHPFPLNTTTSNVNYVVAVTVTPDGSAACPISGYVTFNMAILPGPVAYASTAHLHWMCLPDTALITGTVTNNVTSIAYQWYSVGSGLLPGATDTLYKAGFIDGFYFTDTAANGCYTSSDTVTFIPRCPVGGGSDSTADGYDSSSGGAGCGVLSVTSADTCTTITLNCGSCGSFPVWYAEVIPVSGGEVPPGTAVWVTDSINANHVTATYGIPAIYHFMYVANTIPAGCRDTVYKVDTIGIVTNYRYRLRCAGGSLDSIMLIDYTAYLPWWHIDSIVWYRGITRLGAGSNLSVAYAAPGSYTITHIVYGRRPGGTFMCDDTKTIVLPARPTASFTDATSPICEYVPISFTSTSMGGIIGYSWSFGDGSSILLINPQRTYSWSPTANPEPFRVTLTVTDTIGCLATDTQFVHIYHNTLAGNYVGLNAICSSSAPDTIIFVPSSTSPTPIAYLWNDGGLSDTDYVNTSGSYWVTVWDANQCQFTRFPAYNVRVITPPFAQVYGLQNFCIGQAVNLSGFAGNGLSYAWLRNGATDGTTPTISDFDSVGIYQYQVVLGVYDTIDHLYCYDTSAVDSIHVYPLPPAPTISGPNVIDCNMYELQLVATVPSPWAGVFNWSDGRYGHIDTIYAGGPYRVWFTDLWGCVSDTDTYVPLSPDTWFPYFPTGCYSLCQQQLPLTLFGPPDSTFNYWAWLENGDTVSSSYSTGAGSGSLMGSYTIDSGGNYQWYLYNGLCGQTSDTFALSVVNCVTCQHDSFGVTIACDTDNPAAYTVTLNLFSEVPGITYTLGTDIGPIDPFSGTFTTSGWQPPMTLTFTTLVIPPATPPDSVTIEVIMTLPSGARCVEKRRIPLPSPCGWTEERNGHHSGDSTNTKGKANMQIGTALLVFPNPASGDVTVSYNYGSDSYQNGSMGLSVYDEMGRKVASFAPQSVVGTWNLNTANWMSGIYIIRMEGDGQALQTQRVVISR